MSVTDNTPLTAEEEAKLRAAWKLIGAWTMTESPDENLEYTCPLCDGEGYTDGFRLDAENVTPATIGGYGIGEGLGAAELVANSVGRVLATLDDERKRGVRVLRIVLEAKNRPGEVILFLPVKSGFIFDAAGFTDGWPSARASWDGEHWGTLDWDEDEKGLRIDWSDSDTTTVDLRDGMELYAGRLLTFSSSLYLQEPVVFTLIETSSFP